MIIKLEGLFMKKFLAISVVIALSACSEVASDDNAGVEATSEAVVAEGDEPGFEAVAPGEYEIVHSDASVDLLSVHPGLTWSMVLASDGEGEAQVAGGTIYAQDGKSCFVTEGVEEHQCFADSPLAEDGSMEVTAADGEVVTVRPIAAAE